MANVTTFVTQFTSNSHQVFCCDRKSKLKSSITSRYGTHGCLYLPLYRFILKLIAVLGWRQPINNCLRYALKKGGAALDRDVGMRNLVRFRLIDMLYVIAEFAIFLTMALD